MDAPKEMEMRQLWHMSLRRKNRITSVANGGNIEKLQAHIGNGWYSSLYGQKEKTEEYYFSAEDKIIDTVIKVASDT